MYLALGLQKVHFFPPPPSHLAYGISVGKRHAITSTKQRNLFLTEKKLLQLNFFDLKSIKTLTTRLASRSRLLKASSSLLLLVPTSSSEISPQTPQFTFYNFPFSVYQKRRDNFSKVLLCCVTGYVIFFIFTILINERAKILSVFVKKYCLHLLGRQSCPATATRRGRGALPAT